MKKSIEFAPDDHPAGGEEREPSHWVVAVTDDCEDCNDIRVELTVEEQGRAGQGVTAHLAPASVRHLIGALQSALREVGAG